MEKMNKEFINEMINYYDNNDRLSISDLEVLRESLKYLKYYEEVMREIEKNPIFRQYFRLQEASEEIKDVQKLMSLYCRHIFIKEVNGYRCLACGKFVKEEDYEKEIYPLVIENMNMDEAWFYYKKAVNELETSDINLIYNRMLELKNEFIKTKTK